MSDPLTLLPLAAAAAGGSIDGVPAAQLVAAGLTLLQRSAPLVRALAGRRSAILLPTSQQYLTALAASEGRGAVLVNPLAAPAEIAYQLADADVGAIFTSRAFVDRIPDGVVRVLLDESPRCAQVIAAGATATIDLGSHHGLELEGEAGVEGSDEEAAIVYTSAMAGIPLGAVLTHRNLLANARSTVVAAQATRDDHALAVLPFAHLFGLTVTGMMPLLAGGRVTTMERFNPFRAMELLESEGVTQFVAVPAVFIGLLAAIARTGGRLRARALRVCISGGAVLPLEVQDRWFDATGVELRQGYGLTEAAPVCLFNRVDRPNRRGSLGIPYPGVDVVIRNESTFEALPDGIPGEICVRGANVSPGYLRGGEAGLARRDGWLRTGDRGVRNADGTITFVSVIKPMFTRNGFNVYPREIERVVGTMPGVERVTVRAIPEPTREHGIGLDVVGRVTEAEVKAWCEARLSVYKRPSEVTVSSQ
jgi:long-chain acyl-CoA synthetase